MVQKIFGLGMGATGIVGTLIIAGLLLKAANISSGVYQISVVTNDCKGGCNSNRLSFTLNTSINPTPPSVDLQING